MDFNQILSPDPCTPLQSLQGSRVIVTNLLSHSLLLCCSLLSQLGSNLLPSAQSKQQQCRKLGDGQCWDSWDGLCVCVLSPVILVQYMSQYMTVQACAHVCAESTLKARLVMKLTHETQTHTQQEKQVPAPGTKSANAHQVRATCRRYAHEAGMTEGARTLCRGLMP